LGQRFHSAVIAGESHLIVLPVNATVTKAAHMDANLQRLFGAVTLKMSAPVHFFRNEMVEGQRHATMAARTFPPTHESLS
jgi:hypothetical protein